MVDIIPFDEEYIQWIRNIKQRYQQARIKANVSVNRELIAFYWSLGKDIVQKEADKKYGSGFYDRLSADLRKELPDVTGLSVVNIRYMTRFYRLYSNLPQVVEDLENRNFPQLVENSNESKSEKMLSDLAVNIKEVELFSVPWGHHRLIIDRCKEDCSKAVFFIHKTIENNWSRAVLDNFLDTDLYDRQGKAISNLNYSRSNKTVSAF